MSDTAASVSPTIVSPIVPGDDELRGWSETLPPLMRLAGLWNRYAPRGKGALPRWIARRGGAKWRVLCTTSTGVKLAVDPASIDVYLTILREGSWEPWITRALTAALRPRDVFFDIGANVGCISLEIAHKTGVSVFSFEPQPRLARMIAISAKLNGLEKLTVFSAAVGERSGRVMLNIPAHSVHASLAPTSGHSLAVEVPMVTLDELVESQRLPPPNVIKVDVEGAEFQVLRGARRILQAYAPILLVEANYNSQRFDYTRESILHWVAQQADYEFFLAAPGDVLCVPRARSSEFAGRFRPLNATE